MGRRFCKYQGCSHSAGHNPCKMHRFPADEEKATRWMRSCNLPGVYRNLAANSFVCSCHFEGGSGPSIEAPDPLPVNALQVSEISGFVLNGLST